MQNKILDLWVRRDIRYGDFGSYRIFKVEYSAFLITMLKYTSPSVDDRISNML
jgi:hypothetical protein